MSIKENVEAEATDQMYTKQQAWILTTVLKKKGGKEIHNTIYINFKFIQQDMHT